jgi:hypothetical protein
MPIGKKPNEKISGGPRNRLLASSSLAVEKIAHFSDTVLYDTMDRKEKK